MHWIYLACVCMLIWTGELCATSAGKIPRSSVAAPERDMPSQILGCVNVINGEYFFDVVSAKASGPSPLFLDHLYSSPIGLNPSFRGIYHGLRFFRHMDVGYHLKAKQYNFYIPEASGAVFRYPAGSIGHPHPQWIPFQKEQFDSNWVGEELSASSNLCNQRITLIDGKTIAQTRLLVVGPNGTKRWYMPVSLQDNGAAKHKNFEFISCWHLEHEDLPNGNIIRYQYDRDQAPISITVFNSLGEPLNWITLKNPNCCTLHIDTSDGQHADYFVNKKQQLAYEIRPAEESSIYLEYDHSAVCYSGLVSKRAHPDGRYQIVRYQNIPQKGTRVSEILEPVGADDKPISIARLSYHKDATSNYTDVYDAQNNLTRYRYGTKHRLDSIAYYDKQSLQVVHRFGYTDCLLTERSIEDANGSILSRTTYQYDERGNVVEECLHGNLTGSDVSAGKFVIKRTYDKSDFNLLLSEDDGRKRIEYKYKSGTALLIAKQIYTDNLLKKQESYTYDKNAALESTTVEDTAGRKLIVRYHPRQSLPALGEPGEIEELYVENGIDKLLKRELLSYSIKGKIVRRDIYDATNILRYSLRMEYDDKGNLILETDALGYETRHAYDANNNRIFTEDPNCHFEYRYDFSNRLIQKSKTGTDQVSLTEQYRYDTMNRKVADIDIYGNETHYVYDVFGHLLETHLPAVPDSSGTPQKAVIKKSYDLLGRVIAEIDANGHTTRYRYNVRGQPIETTHPNGSTERSFYNLDGTLARVIHCDGRETRYTRDYEGREIIIDELSVNGELKRTQKEYDAFHLLRVIEPNGRITQSLYDGVGRISSILRDDQVITYTYDALGNLWKVNESGRVTVTEHDLLGHLIEKRVEDEMGSTLFFKERYVYDMHGNLLETIQYPNNQPAITRQKYNSNDDLIESTDAQGHVTHISYDYAYNTTSDQKVLKKTTADPLGNSITIISNAQGKTARIVATDLFGKKLSERALWYDANGNCCETSDWIANNQYIKKIRRYGPGNRLEEVIEAYGTPEAKRTTWNYDNCQRIAAIYKANGVSLFYSYDTWSRIARICASDKSVDDHYSYDEIHRLVQVQDKDGCLLKRVYDRWDYCIEESLSNGITIQRVYDTLGRCRQLTLPDSSKIAYSYSAGRLETVKRCNANGSERYCHAYRQYDLSGRVKQADLINSATLIFDYDACGRCISIQAPYWQSYTEYDSIGHLSKREITDPSGTLAETFTYDGKGQLTVEQGVADHSYAYDGVGNHVYVDKMSQQHNALNQLLSNDQESFTYDANGNLTHYGSALICKYDAYDRLIEVSKGENWSATYTYDAFHRRVKKSVRYYDASEEQTRYLYDGQNEIGAIDETGALIELRLLGLGVGAEIGAAVAIELKSEVYAPIHDTRGTITGLLALEGYLAAHSRYSAFGEQVLHIGPTSPWTYASKRCDPETDWIYFGRRYYSPTLRRWITADPKGEADGPNLYAYLLNDPWNHYDLYGEASEHRSRWLRHSPRSTAIAGYRFALQRNAYRLQGALQAFGGLVETGVGAGMTLGSGGALAPLGWPVMAHGLDHFLTGMDTVFSDRPSTTMTTRLLHKSGLSLSTAHLIDDSIGMSATIGGSAAIRFSRLATLTSFPGGLASRGSFTPAARGGIGLSQKAKNINAGTVSATKSSKVTEVEKMIRSYLGEDAKAFTNKFNDLIIESKNGTKQFRMDINHTSFHKNPHAHVVEYGMRKNRKVELFNERIYPIDVLPE